MLFYLNFHHYCLCTMIPLSRIRKMISEKRIKALRDGTKIPWRVATGQADADAPSLSVSRGTPQFALVLSPACGLQQAPSPVNTSISTANLEGFKATTTSDSMILAGIGQRSNLPSCDRHEPAHTGQVFGVDIISTIKCPTPPTSQAWNPDIHLSPPSTSNHSVIPANVTS